LISDHRRVQLVRLTRTTGFGPRKQSGRANAKHRFERETLIHPLGIRHSVEALVDSHCLEFKARTPKLTPLDSNGAMEEIGG
jgi:hypothetical protein